MKQKDYMQRLMSLADQHGFYIHQGKTKHIRLVHRRSGRSVFAPRTPSDQRSVLNVATKMRRVANAIT